MAAPLPDSSLSSRSLLNRILAAAAPGQRPDVLNIGNTWSASPAGDRRFPALHQPCMARIGSSRSLGPSLAAAGAAGKLPPGASLCDQAYAPYYGKKMFATAYVTGPRQLRTETSELKREGHSRL
jgi:multiple sugar transport system substrate-binding protein